MPSDPAGCTARAVMEAAANAALARYLQALDCGTRRQEAERAYRDHILKAWDRTALSVAGQRRQQTASVDAALAAIRQQDAEAAARRRDIIDSELSAVAVRKLRQTAGAR